MPRAKAAQLTALSLVDPDGWNLKRQLSLTDLFLGRQAFFESFGGQALTFGMRY